MANSVDKINLDKYIKNPSLKNYLKNYKKPVKYYENTSIEAYDPSKQTARTKAINKYYDGKRESEMSGLPKDPISGAFEFIFGEDTYDSMMEDLYDIGENWIKPAEKHVYTGTCSILEGGAFEPINSVRQGLIQTGGEIVSIVAGLFNKSAGENVAKFTQDRVSINIAEDTYSDMTSFIDPEIAHGKVHEVVKTGGNAVTTAAATYYLGPVQLATYFGLSSKGQSAKEAYDNGASFIEAGLVSSIAGGLSALGGIGSKIGKVIMTSEPTINSLAQYYLYAKDVKDENGNLKYSSAWDYYKKSGALLQTGVIGVSNGMRYLSNKFQTKSQTFYNYKLTKAGKEGKILEFYNKNHPEENFKTYKELCNKYPDEVEKIAFDEYRIRTIDENVEWKTLQDYKYEEAKKIYNKTKGYGEFEKLTQIEKDSFINKTKIDVNKNSSKYKNLLDENVRKYIKVADSTIDKVKELKNSGNIKSKYSVTDVINMIEDDVPQSKYLTKKYINNYYSKFNADQNGNCKVVAFQNGDGEKNFSNFNGNLGSEEGMYIMPEDEAKKIIKDCLKSDGSLDSKKLTNALGDVPMGDNTIVITQTVNIQDINMPKGSLKSAYVGPWQPGGKTSGGLTEGVVKQTTYKDSNVEIKTYGKKDKNYYISKINKK